MSFLIKIPLTGKEVFLRCIDPTTAFLAREHENGWKYYDSHVDDAPLNGSNARALVPLFHELQMDIYLRKCDHVIYYTWLKDTAANRTPKESVRLLSFSAKYGLRNTKNCVEKFIGQELEQFFWACGCNPDNFDISTVEELVELLRPMKVRDEVHRAKKQRIEGTTNMQYFKTRLTC